MSFWKFPFMIYYFHVFMCASVCACACPCTICFQCKKCPKVGISYSRTGATDGPELPWRSWELNSGPLEKQTGLLAAELYLRHTAPTKFPFPYCCKVDRKWSIYPAILTKSDAAILLYEMRDIKTTRCFSITETIRDFQELYRTEGDSPSFRLQCTIFYFIYSLIP